MATPPTRGSGQPLVFRIPQAVVPRPEEAGRQKRSLVGVLGRKVLKVLLRPVADLLGEHLGLPAARLLEAKYRPYRVRPFTPDNYTSSDPALVADVDWAQLCAARALLFIHGTFSRAHSGFGALRKETMEALYDRYEGRLSQPRRPGGAHAGGSGR